MRELLAGTCMRPAPCTNHIYTIYMHKYIRRYIYRERGRLVNLAQRKTFSFPIRHTPHLFILVSPPPRSRHYLQSTSIIIIIIITITISCILNSEMHDSKDLGGTCGSTSPAAYRNQTLEVIAAFEFLAAQPGTERVCARKCVCAWVCLLQPPLAAQPGTEYMWVSEFLSECR